jgi:ATP-dependent RNA helicase DeaD
MSTGSDAPDGPGPRARRSCSWRRASGACCDHRACHGPAASSRWTCRRVQRHQLENVSPSASSGKCPSRRCRPTTDLALYYRLVSELEQEDEVDSLQIAAALAHLAQGGQPMLLEASAPGAAQARSGDADTAPERSREWERKPSRERPPRPAKTVEREARPLPGEPDMVMERYRVAVGYRHGVKPGNIVGAIANEAGLESRFIGQIEIHDDFSTVDLPAGMPKETLRDLKKAWICGRPLQITRLSEPRPEPRSEPRSEPRAEPRSAPRAELHVRARSDRPAPQGRPAPEGRPAPRSRQAPQDRKAAPARRPDGARSGAPGGRPGARSGAPGGRSGPPGSRPGPSGGRPGAPGRRPGPSGGPGRKPAGGSPPKKR